MSRDVIQKDWLREDHETFRGSMPSFFIREISVVRLMSMRAAAPSGPATRPFVTFRMRTISSRSLASRVSITEMVLPLLLSSLIGACSDAPCGHQDDRRPPVSNVFRLKSDQPRDGNVVRLCAFLEVRLREKFLSAHDL